MFFFLSTLASTRLTFCLFRFSLENVVATLNLFFLQKSFQFVTGSGLVQNFLILSLSFSLLLLCFLYPPVLNRSHVSMLCLFHFTFVELISWPIMLIFARKEKGVLQECQVCQQVQEVTQATKSEKWSIHSKTFRGLLASIVSPILALLLCVLRYFIIILLWPVIISAYLWRYKDSISLINWYAGSSSWSITVTLFILLD